MTTPRSDRLDKNYFINGNLEISQRALSANLSGSNTYISLDRWKVGMLGSLPTNKTFGRTTVVPANSKSKYSAIFSSDTGVAIGQGYELFQRMESIFARELAGEKASLSFQINASHHQAVRIKMSYPTVENNYTSIVGFVDETLPIAQGSFVDVALENISIPLSVINGIQVEITIIDLISASNNTAIVHNLKLNIGTKAQEFSRAGRNQAEELLLCQRYLEKSYETDIPIGTITSPVNDGVLRSNFAGGVDHLVTFNLLAKKRPGGFSITYYNPTTGATGTWRNDTAGTDLTVSTSNISTTRVTANINSVPAGNPSISGHFVVDAEL